jgi:tetratricopeptide (TPR) repeat protein
MRIVLVILGGLALWVPRLPAIPLAADPLSLAADYYFSRHDYRQAFGLWSEFLRRHPDNVIALTRVCELQVMFEGHAASRATMMKFLGTRGNALSSDVKKNLKETLSSLQTLFLTDEGQSDFLRALPHVRGKDYQGALGLLDHALTLEKGNVKVLKQKARSEKSLLLFPQFYETIKTAYESDPFDDEIVEGLLEAHVYYQQFAEVAKIYQRDPESISLPRERLALAMALLERGAAREAFPIFQSLVTLEKPLQIHPIVWFGMGRILSAQADSQTEAATYLERFLGSVSRPESVLVDGWDPYHSNEKAVEAKALVATIKKRLKEL